MNYTEKLRQIEDSQYLISMVSVNDILRIGFELGLNKDSKVLDLCCGYGTVLKIWNEAFDISGVGVDIDFNFINVGEKRIRNNKIKLICEDILKYNDAVKYDVVICSETIGTIEETLDRGQKFLNKNGVLLFQRVFSEVENVPKELDEFDFGVYTLSKLNEVFNNLGYYITNLATGTDSEWDRYYTWCVRRDIEALRNNPNNISKKEWINTWNEMHFRYRRPYENQALFCLRRL